MYIKNFSTENKSNFKPVKIENLEILKIDKKEDFVKISLKLNNQNYKLIIFKEKEGIKIFAFDSFSNCNVFLIFDEFKEENKVNNSNIVEEGDYYFVVSPLSGKIEKVNEGKIVEKDDAIVVMSAMKMEHSIIANEKYEIVERLINVGDFVDIKQKIVKLKKI